MIGVIDSKICNIFSLTNMLTKLGAEFYVITRPEDFDKARKLILPGVGAYPKAMENLERFRFIDKIKKFVNNGNYLMGICLGMQLLFEKSEEFGIINGLGLISGKIIKINTDKALPHMGWNDIRITQQIPLLKGIPEGADVYFVHSYRAECESGYTAAYAEYGEKIPAVVFKDNLSGTQFHPEKSKKWGEIIMKNFIGL